MLMNMVKNRANVKIVLADGNSYMRQGFRNALTSEGYQDVRTAGRLSTLKDLLAGALPDLLFLDADTPDGDAVALVRDIRAGKLGQNPFMPIVLAVGYADPGLIERVADSGVDLILAKPIAPVQLFARIESLVNNRKPFIATSRYFGPERRDKPRQGAVRQFEVPNTLKDKLEGRPVDPVALSEKAGALLEEMQESRLETSAAILVEKVEEMRAAYDAGSPPRAIGDALVVISRMARDIHRLGDGDVAKLCAVLVRVAGPLLRGDHDLGEKDIELLRPLSQSILLAARADDAEPAVMKEISRMLARYAPNKREPVTRRVVAEAQVAMELMA